MGDGVAETGRSTDADTQRRLGWTGLGQIRSQGQGIFTALSEFRFLSIDHREVSPCRHLSPTMTR